ncbi:hypothetical protein K431DRAFT_270669 [Polychaeton citri CBS 116435]|uniref:Transcription factor domain-containing protein n=1 Tax=Polychaeton citri CBS 116435 TaxID=1314669 RepID=A0A9P4Q4L0_9PEZI|nr:hypothetical protein K431DRAFT_270669 [Polychaeton citri CBS 116435]
MAKGIECHYPLNTHKDTLSKTQQHSDNAILPSREARTNDESHPVASDDVDVIHDGALATSDMEFTHLGWDEIGVDFINFWNSESDNLAIENPSSGPSSSSVTSTTGPSPQAIFSPDKLMATRPTSAVRSLVRRPERKTGAQRIATLILHNLKSFPLMMLRHNSLPPFIHSSVLAPNADNQSIEPLTNCISLMHMISSNVQGSRKLFWKNVRSECEYLRQEHASLDRWKLLAAIQALSVYLLVRLDEGQTDYNNVDSLLIATVTTLSKQLACSYEMHNTRWVLPDYNFDTDWKNWIFDESLRRVCVVYQVVNMLVYFEPAAMCEKPVHIILSPLPASKHLWEASDAFSWKAEIESRPEAQISYGLTADGELIKMNESPVHQNLPAKITSTGTGHWEEWCSGMDGFGGLVMLAASLVA